MAYKNKEDKKNRAKQYYIDNIKKIRGQHKQWHIDNKYIKYGLSHGDWLKIWENQDGKCAICGETFIEPSNACIDHNHKTGEIRGLLCRNCNLGIGLFKDNPELLIKAMEYLLEE